MPGLTDPSAVGRLLRYGLQPRLTPARNGDYAALVGRARNEPEFYSALIATAEGIGLVVIDIDPILGLTVGAADDSPFALRLSDYSRRDSEDRLLHALIHLTIAATAYPSAEALDEDRLVSLTVSDVVANVLSLIERLRERRGAGDPPSDEPGLEPLYRFLARRPATKTTPDNRAHVSTITGATKRAFSWLVDQGFADQVESAGLDTYRLRGRYRLHARDAAVYVGSEVDLIREELRE